MKLEGRDVRLVRKDYHNRVIELPGKIEKIYRDFILVRLKDYKICVGISDILDPWQYILKINENKQWINITKEMLKEGI
ncbi:hypothetical protein QJR52_07090 [Clostridium baratii]|uniref:hypothetical protein n=1 Tax=Clostridium baratii TaxID=1561 RepID=UPI0030D15215